MNCWITDGTGETQIALWNNCITNIYQGCSYHFTNLVTKKYQQKSFVQSTRHTTVSPIPSIQISTGLQQAGEHSSTPHNSITSALQGIQITMQKQCPKCSTIQQDFSPKCAHHRCVKCKILRSRTTYITKLGGIFEFKQNKTDMSLTASNSVLKVFIAT